MADTLFLLGEGGSLKTMSASAYPSEDIFQTLLASHPQLLTDSDFGEDTPRRWALVKREAGVPDLEGGSSRWSLDHLFLDQDGVPTFVEIKRATDTRARREVVAQMLDYAANAVSYWRMDNLVEDFSRTAEREGTSAEERLSKLLFTNEPDTEAFWRAVQANLKSGRVRMIFVADRIAPELVRIVEFMNEQMSPAVVVALELRPFENGADRIISPRLIGQTARAKATKTLASDGITEAPGDWLISARTRWSPARSFALSKFFEILTRLEFRFETSKGGYNAVLDPVGPNRWFTTTATGLVCVNFANITKLGKLASEDIRRAFLAQFNTVPGLVLSTLNSNGYPTFNPDGVDIESGWSSLEAVIADFCAAARSRT